MSTLYGCHSNPRPTPETSYVTQDGWIEKPGPVAPYRLPKYVNIKHAMTCDCRYDAKATDPRCAGCPSQGVTHG